MECNSEIIFNVLQPTLPELFLVNPGMPIFFEVGEKVVCFY
jgi:hypothetical protein